MKNPSWRLISVFTCFILLTFFISKPAEAGYTDDYSGKFGAAATNGISKYGQDIGVHWSRLPIDVKSTDTLNDNFFTPYDTKIKELQQAGVVAYGIINPGDTTITADQFASAVSTIVERYDGDGVDDMSGLSYPIKVWELINEYSSTAQGGPERVSRETFISMISKGALSIKSACSDCYMAYDPFDENDTTALLQSFSASSIDIISFHTYSPLDYASNSDSDVYAPNFAAYLSGLGLSGKPVWTTEYAMYDSKGSDRSAGVFGSQEDNARWFIQTTAWGFGTGLFTKMIYTEIEPPMDASSDKALGWMALVDENGGKRQIYYAYQKLISLIDKFSSATELSLGTNIYGYKFKVGTNNVFVLWMKETTASQSGVTLSGLTSTSATVINSVPATSGTFESSTATPVNGAISLDLTNTPVYVVESSCYSTYSNGTLTVPDYYAAVTGKHWTLTMPYVTGTSPYQYSLTNATEVTGSSCSSPATYSSGVLTIPNFQNQAGNLWTLYMTYVTGSSNPYKYQLFNATAQ